MSDETPAPDTTAETPDTAKLPVDELIHQLDEAVSDRRNARNWMTLLLALVIVVFVFLGVDAVERFQTPEKMDELKLALTDEAAALLPSARDQLSGSVERVLPAYQDAFVEVFTRDTDKYLEVIAEEGLKFESFAAQARPKIEEAIAELVVAQEETARKELTRYMTPEEYRTIRQAYEEALTERLQTYFDQRFSESILLAEDVMAKLETIAESEKDLPPADSQFVLGMFLELLGIEMQHATETADTTR